MPKVAVKKNKSKSAPKSAPKPNLKAKSGIKKPSKGALRTKPVLKAKASKKKATPVALPVIEVKEQIPAPALVKIETENANGVIMRRSVSPIAGSMQAELKLTELQAKIKSNPHFERDKNIQLKELWDPSWPRAPFEECLTLKQLTELDSATLLKKKSLNPLKVAALLDAIEVYLKKVGSTESVETPVAAVPILKEPPGFTTVKDAEPVIDKKTLFVAPSQESSAVTWSSPDGFIPSHAQAFLRFYEIQCRALQRESFTARLLKGLPKALKTEEFIFLWFFVDYDETLIKEFLKISPEDVAALKTSAMEKLGSWLRQNAPEVFSHWTTSLACPGISKQELIRGYYLKELDSDFQKTVLLIALRALQAGKPQAFGYTFREYLSSKPGALETLLGFIYEKLPVSDAELRTLFSSLLPLIRPEDLLSALKKKAHFDGKKGLWTK